jgi:uncharacterized protein YdhG (YjbR/CyaY superfamily)
MNKPIDVDAYISSFPVDVQKLLEQMRSTVKTAAPQAVEVISYGIPAFKLNGVLVWFAAHTNHIGLYPRGSGLEEFKTELLVYKTGKGSVQFPFSKPLPLELVAKIVKFRVEENLLKKRK